MAYQHTEYEVAMTTSKAVGAGGRGGPGGYIVFNNATAAGGLAVGRWGPGYVPHVVRNVAVQMAGTGAFVTKPVISFRTAPAGSTGTVSGNQFVALTLTSIAGTKATKGSTTGRTTWYKSALQNQVVNPGIEVQAVITTAATIASLARLILYVEPKWETPANITAMKTA